MRNWNKIKQDYKHKNKLLDLTTIDDYIHIFTKLRDRFSNNDMMYNAINNTINEIKQEKYELLSPKRKGRGDFYNHSLHS